MIIGLFAAILAAALSPAAGAMAATASPPKPVKAAPLAPIDPARRAEGKKAAPGVVTAAKLNCDVTDARHLGDQTDPKTKAVSSLYELACKDSEGFVVVMHPAPAAPDVFTCLEVAGSGGACQLPANADPKMGLAPLVSKIDPDCTLAQARGLGHTSDGSLTAFEVACTNGDGFNLETSFPLDPAKPVKLVPCVIYDQATGAKCTFTTAASHQAFIDRFAAQANKDCVVKDRRVMGATDAGVQFFEVSCQNGKGYILSINPNLTLAKSYDCETTQDCQLTDVRAHHTEQAGLYTKLAHAGGFPCDVSEYAPFDVNLPGHEVVELSCTNRPDGAVAIFPASSAEKPLFYDCAHSELEGYRCGISKPEAALPSLTADLRKLNKSECTVSASRFVGVTADGHGYVEVGCSDGLPGYTVEFTVKPLAPTQAFPCTGPSPVQGGCQLAGNTKK
jgi:hypothetical protein